MERIRTVDLQSAYGKHWVLSGVNLSVERGQIAGIVGANGCGKSTFLQILSGLRKADEGSIYLDGQEAKGKAGRTLIQRYVGYVPQESNLIEELSVRDNLLLWYQDRKELEQELQSGFLHTLGLDEICGLKAGRLSGGMKKKVSIGCALAGAPPILLLDEPNAALDLPTKSQIRHYLIRYKEMGGTIVIATHDESDLELCDCIYSLSKGKANLIDPSLRGDALIHKL